MPGSISETLDTLYTTTWYHRKQEVADGIFDSYPLMKWMRSKGHLKTLIGGRRIEQPIEYVVNPQVSWITKGSTVTLADFDPLTVSYWDWKYLTGSMVRFGIDDQQNRGKMAIFNIMNTKINNTRRALTKDLETKMFAGQASGNEFDGLQWLVKDDPTTSSTIGNINQSTYTWWRNQAANMTGRSFTTYGVIDMREMYNDIITESYTGMPCDVIVSGQAAFQYYEDNVLDYYRTYSNKLGDLGIRNIMFKETPMIWSPSCGTRMYFLNTDYFYMYYDPMWNFDMTEWKSIPNQVEDKAAQIKFACALVCSNRRAQGVIYNVDTA